MVVNVALPITGGHILMGTDATAEMGFTLVQGNNVHISLWLDTRTEADTLFAGLSKGGQAQMPMSQMFWGDSYGSLVDRFGTRWMISSHATE